MLSKKIAVFLLTCFVSVFGRDSSTQIIHFHATNDDLFHLTKKFFNHTKHTIRLRWRLTDRKTNEFIGQEPIVAAGGIVKVDVEAFLKQFRCAAGISGYDFVVEVARIIKDPKQIGDEIIARSFKNGPSSIQITKSVYLVNRDYQLLQSETDILSCRVMGGSRS